MIIDGLDLDRVVHWLPYGATENDRTACGLNVRECRGVQWVSAQNEATCKRCLAATNVPDLDPPVLRDMQGGQ